MLTQGLQTELSPGDTFLVEVCQTLLSRSHFRKGVHPVAPEAPSRPSGMVHSYVNLVDREERDDEGEEEDEEDEEDEEEAEEVGDHTQSFATYWQFCFSFNNCHREPGLRCYEQRHP